MELLYPENSYNNRMTDFVSLYNSVKQSPYLSTSADSRTVVHADVSKYPYQYVIGADNEELRAYSQSIWDQWGNAAVRTASQLVLGTLKAGTDIPDVFRAFMGPDGLAALADEEFSNDLSAALGKAMEDIKEATPIYLEKDERGLAPWKAAWWATNLESIATGATMLLPIMGAAKGATWAAQMVGKAMQGSKAAGLIMGKNSTAMMGSVIGALYGNAYESMQEMQQLMPELSSKLKEAGKSDTEIRQALKEEAAKIYWGNLPNAALDMLGVFQLTKPFGGQLVETNMKKRLWNTTKLEVLPEGLQELRNHYVSERARASVDKRVGLRSEDYSLAEFVKDPNAWTAGFFGALGGAAFAGGASMVNQVAENISENTKNKTTWHKKMFSNAGSAALSGLTKGEQKLAADQRTELDKFAARVQKLEELKTISELSGNKELYDEVQTELHFVEGLKHLSLGTFDRFIKHLEDVQAQLNGLETDEQAKANPALRQEVKDSTIAIIDLKNNLLKAQKHYNKGIKYYGLDSARLFDYTAFSVDLESERERLNRLIAGRDEMFAEDEFGVLRTTTSPKVEALKEKIAKLEEAIDTGTTSGDLRERSLLAEIQALKDEVANSTDARTLNDEVELNIGQASLNIRELELRIKNILKDKNYKDSGEDFFDSHYNEEKLKDLYYKAYNSKFNKDLSMKEISDELVKGKVPLSTESRDKIMQKVNEEIADVKASFYERLNAIIAEREGIDPKTLDDDQFAEYEEKYRREVEQSINSEVVSLQDIKNLAMRRTNYNPKRRSIEEVIHDYVQEEIKEVVAQVESIEGDPTNTDLKTLVKLLDRIHILGLRLKSTKYTVSEADKKEVDETAAYIKKIIILIGERVEEQSKTQAFILENFVNDIISTIEAIKPYSGDAIFPVIDAAIKAIAADKELIKGIENTIAVKAAEFRQASVNMVPTNSKPLFEAQPGFSMVAAQTTPEQYLMSLMAIAYAPANAPNQREYELALDTTKIIEDPVNKSTVDAYNELLPFVKLLRLIKSDKTLTQVATAIKEVAAETGEMPFPDQFTSLLELGTWYSSTVDIAYLQGVAGSGKTNLVSKHLPSILNKLYKLDKKEIQALSNSPNTDRLIRKAVFGVEELRDIITNDPEKLKAALLTAKFLILDEIGKFSESEIATLFSTLYGPEGIITQGHRLKILLTGDPNQFVNSVMTPSLVPALNAYLSPLSARVQVISPLVFSVRANNTEVIEFQNKFLKAGKDNVYTNGTVFSGSYDSDDQNGVRISPSRETLKAVANKKLQAKENFAIIVEDDSQKSQYKEFEADGVKRVYTFMEAQGSEWDSILVDIQTYKKNSFGYIGSNKMMYTALSRARNYMFVLTTSIPENKPFNELSPDETAAGLVDLSQSRLNNNKKFMSVNLDILLGLKKKEDIEQEDKKEEPTKPKDEAKPEEPKPGPEPEPEPKPEQDETPFQEPETNTQDGVPVTEEEIKQLNNEEVVDDDVAKPIPGIKLNKVKNDALLKNPLFEKAIGPVPIEKSGNTDVKFVTFVVDEAGNIYFMGLAKDIPNNLDALLRLGAVKQELVKVQLRRQRARTLTSKDKVVETRMVLRYIPTNIVREAKWRAQEGKAKKKSGKKRTFTPTTIAEAVEWAFANGASISGEYAASMFPPESEEFKRAVKDKHITKGGAKSSDDFWDKFSIGSDLGALGMDKKGSDALSLDQAKDIETAIQDAVFSGTTKGSMKEGLLSLQEDRVEEGSGEFNGQELDERALREQQEHDAKSLEEAEYADMTAEEYFQMVSSLRSTINAVARENYDGTTFNYDNFINDPRIQAMLPILSDDMIKYLKSLEQNYSVLIKKFPRYDGVVRLKRNADGTVNEDTSTVLIAYRSANPNDPNRDNVVHKVYLLQLEFGYTELAVTSVPDTSQARLSYNTDYSFEEIQNYAASGGMLKKGKVTDFGKRKFIYDFNNPRPISELQQIIEKVFRKSDEVINRRTVGISPIEYFVATSASISLINEKYLKGKSPLKLIDIEASQVKQLAGDGHELFMLKGNPYVLIGIETSNLDGSDLRTEYKVVQLSGKKLNLNSSKTLKDLSNFYSTINNVESIFKNEFNFIHRYGSSSNQVEIDGEMYQEGSVFINSLYFRIEEDSIVSESDFPEVNALHEAINKHPNKKGIIDALLAVKNSLYTYEELDAMAVAGSIDFQSYEPYINEFVVIPGTKVTPLDSKTAMNLLKDPSLHEFFTSKGFKFVIDSSNRRTLEARRTFEVGARDASGMYRVFHVMVSVPFERADNTIGSWILNTESSPIIEIFKVDADTYGDYVKNDKNEEAKKSALHRSRDNKQFEKNKIFDSTDSQIPLPAGMAALDAVQELVTKVLTRGRKKKKLTPADEAMNLIAKANGKIWVTDSTYVKIQRLKQKTYEVSEEGGGKKTTITYGPKLTGHEVLFPLYQVVNVNGKLEEQIVNEKKEFIDGKEVHSFEGLDLRELLELILNPESYDANGDSTHNKSYTSISGEPAKVGLREAIQDRPIKRANEVMRGGLDPTSEEGQTGLAEMDKLAVTLVKFEETFVDIEEDIESSLVPTAQPQEPSAPSDLTEDIKRTFLLDEDAVNFDEEPPFFHLNEANVSNSNLISEEEAIAYIKRYIPDFDSSAELRASVNNVIIGMKKYGPEILGAYKQGILYLTMNESNRLELEVLRHELFHKLFDTYLPPATKAALMMRVRAIHNIAMTDLQVEEFLARKFQAFTVNEEESDSMLLAFFKWFSELIKGLFSASFRHEKAINVIFSQIERGAFNKKIAVESPDVKFMKDVNSLFPARTTADSQAAAMKAINYVKYAIAPHIENQDVIEESTAEILSSIISKFVDTLRDNKTFKKRLEGQDPAVVKQLVLGYMDPSKSLKEEDRTNKELVKETYLKSIDFIASLGDPELLNMYYLVLYRGRAYRAILDEVLPNKDLSEVKFKQIYEDAIKAIPEEEDGEMTSNLEARNNFHEEYMQNATVNQETRVSKELKILLAFVKRPDLMDFLPSRYAYAKTIESFMYLNSNSEITAQIKRMQASGRNSNEARLATHLEKLLTTATEKGFNVKKPGEKAGMYYTAKNLPMLDAVTFRNQKFQVYGREVEEFGRTETGVVTRLGTASYEDRVLAILQKDGPIDLDVARAALKFIKKRDFSRDVVAKLYHELGSQVEIMPVVDQVSLTTAGYDDMDFQIAMDTEESLKEDFLATTYNISAAGVKQNIVASVRTSLQDLILTKTKAELEQLRDKMHIMDLRDILKLAGVTSFVGKTFTQAEVATIKQMFKSVINTIVINHDTAISDPSNIRGYLDELSFKSFTEVFTRNADFLTTLSYKGADGNTRYTYVTGSWIYDVLGALNFGRPNEYTSGNGYVAKNNYYIQNRTAVYNTADFDKMKQKNSDFDAVAYKGMSPGQFLAHRFIYGFVGTITRGKDKDRPRYIQYSFIQSNRNADTGIETSVMKEAELKKAFEMAKAMENARVASLEKNVNYGVDKLRFMQYETFEDFKKAMRERAFKTFQTFIDNMEQVPGMSLTSSKGRRLYNSKEAVKRLVRLGLYSEKEIESLLEVAENRYPSLKTSAHELLPLWLAYYTQNYLGSFHITTAVFGDLAFAKDVNDLVKRMQGVNSPGRKQLVTTDPDSAGNKPVSKMQVVQDALFPVSELNDIKRLFPKIYGALNSTDGYTMGIPLTLRGIHKGTGDYNLKDIIKVVSFYIDPVTNETRYLKSALFIITDELARMFPSLRDIRRKLETVGLDSKQLKRYDEIYSKILSKTVTPKEASEYEELIKDAVEYYATESALKIGRPRKEYLPKYGETNTEGVIQIYNRYVRIQSNPFHDEGSVADPSQFNYFINVNGKNEEEAFKVYNKIEQILTIKQRLLEISDKLVTKDAEGKNIVTPSALRTLLINQMKNSPSGDDKVYNMLKEGVDVNYPAVISKAIIALMNTMSKNSVELRHSGNKLVSQSAVGVRMYEVNGKVTTFDHLTLEDRKKADYLQSLPASVIAVAIAFQDLLMSTDPDAKSFLRDNIEPIKSMHGFKGTKAEIDALNSIFDESTISFKDNVLVPRRLRMRDDEGFTEVIAPKWWLDKMGYRIGDKAFVLEEDYKKLLNTGMAVRIPTTGIHSAIALKIVASTDEGFNRIIAPEELVAIHGSDFDIDALFAIRRETFDDYIFTSDILKRITDDNIVKFIKDSSLSKVNRGDLVGYSFDGKYDKKFREDLETLLTMPLPNKALEIALNMQMKVIMNEKLDIEIGIITAAKNSKDANTPISFELIKHDLFKNEGSLDSAIINKQSFNEILYHPDYGVITKLKLARGKNELQPPRDPFDIIDQMKYHKDNFEGAAGTGIQANMSKATSYMMYAAPLIIDKGAEVLVYENREIADITYSDDQGSYGVVTLKDGSVHEGKLSRQPVPIPTKINLSYQGRIIHFDSLVMESRIHGHKTYELADTVLNGYLDNVKEQITWIMNATPVTIETIAYMISIGMDLDLIAFMLNQSSLKEYATSKMSKESRLAKEIKYLISKLKDTPIVDQMIKRAGVKNLDELLKLNLLSFEDLAGSLNYESSTGETYSQLKERVNKYEGAIKDPGVQKYLFTQLSTLNAFQKLMQDAAVVGDIARILDVLRSFKITPEDIYKKRKDFAKLDSALSKFGGLKLFDIPNIRNARNAFFTAVDYYKGAFPVYSPEVETSMEQAIDALGLVTTSNGYKLEGTNYAFIHGEFQSIVASMVAARYKQKIMDNNMFFVPESNIINTATGLFVKPEDVTPKMIEDGAIESLSPEQAYVQIFLERLRTVKNDMPENMFLASLNINIGDNGILSLDFHRGSGNNPEYDALVETHFSQLPAEISEALIYYDLYYNKAKFGFRSYSHHMGTQVSKMLSDMYMVELNRAVSMLKEDEYFLHYMTYLLLKNREVANYSRATYYAARSNHGDHLLILNALGIPEDKAPFYKTIAMPKNGLKSTFIADGKYVYMLVGAYTDKGELLSYDSRQGLLSFNHDLRKPGENSPNAFIFKKIDRISRAGVYNYDFELERQWREEFTNAKELTTVKKDQMKELLETGNLVRTWDSPMFFKNRKGEVKERNFTAVSLTTIAVTTDTAKNAIEVLFERDITTVQDPSDYTKNKVIVTERFKLAKDFKQLEANYQKTSTGSAVSVEAIKSVASKLSQRFGIKVEYVDDPKLPWSGMFKGGKVYINLAKAKLDTPFHEFTHPFIAVIKKTNKALYDNLVKEIKQSEVYSRIKETRKDLTPQSQIEEAIVEAIGLYASKKIAVEESTSLISLLEEFLQFITELLRELLRSNLVNPATINASMTLEDIATLVANTDPNNKIDILGEFEKREIFEHLLNQGLIKYVCKR